MSFKNYILPFISLLLLSIILNACVKGEKVDLIIYNARIHSMDKNNTLYEALAVKEGRIIAIGPEREILNRFRSEKEINAGKKDILPGLHDCHGHLLGLARKRLQVDLSGAQSIYEVIRLLEKHQDKYPSKYILGWGWDQNKWGDTLLPTNTLLNESFPSTPVVLSRTDAHTYLVNEAMINLLPQPLPEYIEGGTIQFDTLTGKPTGIFTDQAMNIINNELPEPADEEMISALNEIQNELLSYGVTSVHEAGISSEQRELLMQLNDSDQLKINVYAMLFQDENNKLFALNNGFHEHKNLFIRSFKVILDGALGSEGACLLDEYHSTPKHYGQFLVSPQEFIERASFAKKVGYQLNTHCIGDSSNRFVLKHLDTLLANEVDHRWRIEHAQVVDPNDFPLFSSSDVIPSVQPTHAVSDFRFAQNKLGDKRIEGAYAYRTLLDVRKMILFGTDFPVEYFDPFATIHAATHRKNTQNQPLNGFYPQQSVSLEESLRAMTIWAAYGSFSEKDTGSLEKGKEATFVILDQPLMISEKFSPNYAFSTFIRGEEVYQLE